MTGPHRAALLAGALALSVGMTPAAQGTSPPLQSLATDPLSAIDESAEEDAAPEPAPRKRRRLVSVEERLFGGLETGPYAPETRDKLNEMIVRSSLSAYGVPLPPTSPSETRKLLAAVPSHVPAVGYVTSEFGYRRSPFTGTPRLHKGIDIGAPHGSPIYAAADGIVAFAGSRGPLGRIVVINHGYGITTKYAHASRVEVRKGDLVRRGDVIGRVGNTGRSTGTHLHFEVRVKGKPIDPTRFMFDAPAELDPLPVARLALQLPEEDGLLGGGAVQAGGEEDYLEEEEEGELGRLVAEVTATPRQQTPVPPSGYELLPALELTPYGMGGETEGAGDAPERGFANEQKETVLLSVFRLLPVNLGIVFGFALLSLVLIAGDHLPTIRYRRQG